MLCALNELLGWHKDINESESTRLNERLWSQARHETGDDTNRYDPICVSLRPMGRKVPARSMRGLSCWGAAQVAEQSCAAICPSITRQPHCIHHQVTTAINGRLLWRNKIGERPRPPWRGDICVPGSPLRPLCNVISAARRTCNIYCDWGNVSRASLRLGRREKREGHKMRGLDWVGGRSVERQRIPPLSEPPKERSNASLARYSSSFQWLTSCTDKTRKAKRSMLPTAFHFTRILRCIFFSL